MWAWTSSEAAVSCLDQRRSSCSVSGGNYSGCHSQAAETQANYSRDSTWKGSARARQGRYWTSSNRAFSPASSRRSSYATTNAYGGRRCEWSGTNDGRTHHGGTKDVGFGIGRTGAWTRASSEPHHAEYCSGTRRRCSWEPRRTYTTRSDTAWSCRSTRTRLRYGTRYGAWV